MEDGDSCDGLAVICHQVAEPVNSMDDTEVELFSLAQAMGSLEGTVTVDENSMSGLSDCLVELEVSNEDQEIPFRSYLDNNGSLSDEEIELCRPSKALVVDASTTTASPSALWPDAFGYGPAVFPVQGHALQYVKEEVVSSVYPMDEQPLGNYPEVKTTVLSPANKTPDRPGYLSSGRNSRTPTTLLRLQEKHRENERVRHHTLIKNMKAVCSRVPGYDEANKETKVVMMQRVVDYICHLEKHIQGLTDELGLTLDLSSTFLINKINKRADDWSNPGSGDRGWTSYNSQHADPVLSRYIPESIIDTRTAAPQTPCSEAELKHQLRRQKISSPTVGSSSDPLLPCVTSLELDGSQSSLSSQDSGKPTPSNIPFVDDIEALSTFYQSQGLDNMELNIKTEDILVGTVEESLGFTSADDFGVSSSLCMPACAQANSPVRLGGPGRYDCPKEGELQAVNPDRILPTKSCSPLSLDNLVKLIQDKKETYLERPPLSQITNIPKSDGKMLGGRTTPAESPAPIINRNLRSDIGRKDDDRFVSYLPYIWKFHDISMSRRQKAAAARVQSQAEKENDELIEAAKMAEDKTCKPIKVDLRKTSWMNGFMMFSRINRRKFIEANPGVHTSHISKMMGHSWRNMSEEEQQPYKDKAKKYMQYMQRSSECNMFGDQLERCSQPAAKSDYNGDVKQLNPTLSTSTSPKRKLEQGKRSTATSKRQAVSLLKKNKMAEVKTFSSDQLTPIFSETDIELDSEDLDN